MVVLERDLPVAIGQTVRARSDENAEAIRDPFPHEVDADLVVMTNIRANIEQTVRCPRRCQQRAEPTADGESKPAHREGDKRYNRPPVMEVQLKGNMPLEHVAIDVKVHEQCSIPIAVKERPAFDSLEATPSDGGQGLARRTLTRLDQLHDLAPLEPCGASGRLGPAKLRRTSSRSPGVGR